MPGGGRPSPWAPPGRQAAGEGVQGSRGGVWSSGTWFFCRIKLRQGSFYAGLSFLPLLSLDEPARVRVGDKNGVENHG